MNTHRDGDPWQDGDPCEVCEEDGTPNDPVAHFLREDGEAYVMAHGQCGEDAGLRLA